MLCVSLDIRKDKFICTEFQLIIQTEEVYTINIITIIIIIIILIFTN